MNFLPWLSRVVRALLVPLAAVSRFLAEGFVLSLAATVTAFLSFLFLGAALSRDFSFFWATVFFASAALGLLAFSAFLSALASTGFFSLAFSFFAFTGSAFFLASVVFFVSGFAVFFSATGLVFSAFLAGALPVCVALAPGAEALLAGAE